MSKSIVKPFHKFRPWTGTKEVDGKEQDYTMAFVEFKEPKASLSTKEQFVTFDLDVMEELSNAGRGDLIELEISKSENGRDPVITDAQIKA